MSKISKQQINARRSKGAILHEFKSTCIMTKWIHWYTNYSWRLCVHNGPFCFFLNAPSILHCVTSLGDEFDVFLMAVAIAAQETGKK